MKKPPLRERVLGFLVILALCVIFYPFVFVGREARTVDRDSQIPAVPDDARTIVYEEAQAPEVMRTLPERQAQYHVDPSHELALPETPPILDDRGRPNTWVLQVGVYASEDNANEDRDALIASGLRAFIQRHESTTDQPTLFHVLIGPYLDAQALQSDHQNLLQTRAESPMILPYGH